MYKNFIFFINLRNKDGKITIWTYFTKNKSGKDICNLCNAEYVHSGSFSVHVKHIEKKHPEKYV